jgi:hypothetical protein
VPYLSILVCAGPFQTPGYKALLEFLASSQKFVKMVVVHLRDQQLHLEVEIRRHHMRIGWLKTKSIVSRFKQSKKIDRLYKSTLIQRVTSLITITLEEATWKRRGFPQNLSLWKCPQMDLPKRTHLFNIFL